MEPVVCLENDIYWFYFWFCDVNFGSVAMPHTASDITGLALCSSVYSTVLIGGMATPRRNDELTDGGRNADERYSNEAPRSNSQKVQSKIMQGGSPLTTKARQVQRRYRSLFHQGAKEVRKAQNMPYVIYV